MGKKGGPSIDAHWLPFSTNSWRSSVCLQLRQLFLKDTHSAFHSDSPRQQYLMQHYTLAQGKPELFPALSLSWITIFGLPPSQNCVIF